MQDLQYVIDIDQIISDRKVAIPNSFHFIMSGCQDIAGVELLQTVRHREQRMRAARSGEREVGVSW
jgi:hypothetical protein